MKSAPINYKYTWHVKGETPKSVSPADVPKLLARYYTFTEKALYHLLYYGSIRPTIARELMAEFIKE